MARRFIPIAVIAAFAAAAPSPSLAATAPASAPVLTSALYVFPLTLRWTPGNDATNASQSIYRSSGTCTSPVQAGGPITTFPGNATTDFTGRPVDGTYCYYVRATDLLGGTANGPGVTVAVDTTNPSATIAVAGQAPGGVVSGAVGVSGTSSDAVAGVASSVLRAGAAGACAAGPVIGSTWDTTGVANGAYEVCNVVTDNAGHVTTARLTVTVANPGPIAAPAASAAVASGASGEAAATPSGGSAADRRAPGAPTKLKVRLLRAKPARGACRCRCAGSNRSPPISIASSWC